MSDILREIEALKEKVNGGKASPSEKLRLKRLKLDLEEMRLAQKSEKIARQKRAEETKMKIILGAWVLQNANQQEMRNLINKNLASFLSEKDKIFMAEFLETLS